MPVITGTAEDPKFRHERAVHAGTVSQSTDKLIERVVRRAGELTPEHIEKLRGLLPPVEDSKAET